MSTKRQLAALSRTRNVRHLSTMTITDPDFLTNPEKQLRAVEDLANLRSRLVDLQTEVLKKMHERRELLQRLADEDLERQRDQGRHSTDFAMKQARASDEVRQFDKSKRELTEQIQRLKIEIQRHRFSIRIAIVARGGRKPGGKS